MAARVTSWSGQPAGMHRLKAQFIEEKRPTSFRPYPRVDRGYEMTRRCDLRHLLCLSLNSSARDCLRELPEGAAWRRAFAYRLRDLVLCSLRRTKVLRYQGG